MSKPDEYRHLAQECLETACTSASEQTRIALLLLAQGWFRLAQQHEEKVEASPVHAT